MLGLVDHYSAQVLGVLVAYPPVCTLETGNTVEVLGINAHMHLKVVGLGNALANKGAGVAAVGPANQLANNPAIGRSAVTDVGTRFPPQGLGRHDVGHCIPVVHDGRATGQSQRRDTGGMAQHLAQGDVLLAALGKFRPIMGNGLVQLQLALFHQHQRRDGGEGFDAAIGVNQRVMMPGLVALKIRHARP